MYKRMEEPDGAGTSQVRSTLTQSPPLQQQQHVVNQLPQLPQQQHAQPVMFLPPAVNQTSPACTACLIPVLNYPWKHSLALGITQIFVAVATFVVNALTGRNFEDTVASNSFISIPTGLVVS